MEVQGLSTMWLFGWLIYIYGMGFCGIFVNLWSLYYSLTFNDWMTAITNAMDTCYSFMNNFY